MFPLCPTLQQPLVNRRRVACCHLSNPILSEHAAYKLPESQPQKTQSVPQRSLLSHPQTANRQFISREHTVLSGWSRQTPIPCQRPSQPSNPDPHQRPGPGPRPRPWPWPSAHQTLRKRDNEQEQERGTGGKTGSPSCFSPAQSEAFRRQWSSRCCLTHFINS